MLSTFPRRVASVVDTTSRSFATNGGSGGIGDGSQIFADDVQFR